MENETSRYDEKFKEMQQYIPFLDEIMNKIENVANETNQSVRGIQLSKIKSLKSLLCMTENRMKMENLLRCEEILKKLKNKMEKSSKSIPLTSDSVIVISDENDANSDIIDVESYKEVPKSLNFYKEYQVEEDSDNKSKLESTNDTNVPTSDLEICRRKLRELTKDSLVDDCVVNVDDSTKPIKPLEKEIKIVTEAYIKGEIKVIPDIKSKTSKMEKCSEFNNEDKSKFKTFKQKNTYFNFHEKYRKTKYQNKRTMDKFERNTYKFSHRKDVSVSFKKDKNYTKHGNDPENNIHHRRSTSRSKSSQSCDSPKPTVSSHKPDKLKEDTSISSKKSKRKHKKNKHESIQRSKSHSPHSSKSSCSVSELDKSEKVEIEISNTSNNLSTNSEVPISDAVSLSYLLKYRNQLKKELEDGEIIESDEDPESSTKIEPDLKSDIKSSSDNKESSNIKLKNEDGVKQAVSINDSSNVTSEYDSKDKTNLVKNKISEKSSCSSSDNLNINTKNSIELSSKKHTTDEILQKLSNLSYDCKSNVKETHTTSSQQPKVCSNQNINKSEISFEKDVLEALKSEIKDSNIHSDIFENVTQKQKECSPQGKKMHVENDDTKKVRRISFEKYKEKINSPLYDKVLNDSKLKNDFDTMYNNQVEILNRVLTPKEIERFDSVIERTVVDTIVDSSFKNRLSALQPNEDSSELLGPASPDSDGSFQYSQYDSPVSEIRIDNEAIDKMKGNIQFENEISSPNDFSNDHFKMISFEDAPLSPTNNTNSSNEKTTDSKIFNTKEQVKKQPQLTHRFNVNFPVSANYRGKNPKPIFGFSFKKFRNQNEVFNKPEKIRKSSEFAKSISKPCVEKSELHRKQNVGPVVVDENSRHDSSNKSWISDSQKNVEKYAEYSSQIRRNSNIGRPKSESSKELNLHKSFRISKETYSSNFANSDLYKYTKQPLLPTPQENVTTNVNHLWSVSKNDPRRHIEQQNRNTMNSFVAESDKNMFPSNTGNVLKDPRLKKMDNQCENAEKFLKSDISQQKVNSNTDSQKDIESAIKGVDIDAYLKSLRCTTQEKPPLISTSPKKLNTASEKNDDCLEASNSKHQVSKQEVQDTRSNEVNNSNPITKGEIDKNIIIIDESNNFVIYDEIDSSSQKNISDKSKLHINEIECKVNDNDKVNDFDDKNISQDQKFESLYNGKIESATDIKKEEIITTDKPLDVKNSASDENNSNMDTKDSIANNNTCMNTNESSDVAKPSDTFSIKTDDIEKHEKIDSYGYEDDIKKVTDSKNNIAHINVSTEECKKNIEDCADEKDKSIGENNQKLNNEEKKPNHGGDADLVSSLVDVLKNKGKMQEMLLLLSKKGEDLPPKVKKKLELLVNFESDDEVEENQSDTSETLHIEASGSNLCTNIEETNQSFEDIEANKKDTISDMRNKGRGKFRNEVALLREGLPEIFINQGGLNPTGIRMCRLAKEFNNENNVGKRRTRQAEKSCVKTRKTSPPPQKIVPDTKNNNKIKEKHLSISVQKLEFLNIIRPVETQENNEDETYKNIRPCPKSKKSLMLSKKETSISAKMLTVKNNEDILVPIKSTDIDRSNIDMLTHKNIEKKNNPSKTVRRRKKRGHRWRTGVITKKCKKINLRKKSPMSPIRIIEEPSFKFPSENEQLSDLKSYHFSSNVSNYECKYCDYNDEYIVKHYVESHPHSEILISRLSESEAVASMTEMKSTCNSLLDSCNYQCRFCQKIFMQSSADVFYKHVIYFHTGEYENICKICIDKNNIPTTCKNKFAIERIEGNVGILKGYVCEKCNYTQILKANLDIHIKLCHPNIKCKVFEVNLCAVVSSVNDNEKSSTSVVNEPIVNILKIKEKDTTLSRQIEINYPIIEKNLPTQSEFPSDEISENECDNTGIFSLSEMVSDFQTELNSIDIRNVESLNNFDIKEEIMENIQDIDVNEEILNVEIKYEVDETINEGHVSNTCELTPLNSNRQYNTMSGLSESTPLSSNREYNTTSGLPELTPLSSNIQYNMSGLSNDECERLFIANIYIEKFSSGTVNYSCQIQNCSFSTKYTNVLRSHIELVHSSSIWDLSCKYCDNGIKQVYRTQVPHMFVVDHIINNHMGDIQKTASNFNTIIESINQVNTASNSPKIIVRPLSDLLPKENVILNSQQKDDCLPRISSVVSLNPDNDVSCEAQPVLKVDSVNNEMMLVDKIQELGNEASQECPDLFICGDKTCSFTTNNEMMFRNHCINHKVFFNSNPIDGFLYRMCVYCKMKFQDDSAIWKHIIEEHGHCQYKCTSCIFRSTSYILVYMHSMKQHPFVDNHRRVTLVQEHSLSSQKKNTYGMLSKHNCFQPYICTVKLEVFGPNNPYRSTCEKRFYTPASFLNHIEEKHKDEKLFCSYCDEVDMTPTALTFHLRTEHNFYLFKCAYCKNGADTQISILHHLLRCHQFRKPIFYVFSQIMNNQSPRIVKIDVDENIDYYMKNIFGETVSVRIPQKTIIEKTITQSLNYKKKLTQPLVGDNENSVTEKVSSVINKSNTDHNLIETDDLETNSTHHPSDIIIVDSDDDASVNISNKSEELKDKSPTKKTTDNKRPNDALQKIKNISREANKITGLVGKDLYKCGNENCVYSCDTLNNFTSHISVCDLGTKRTLCYHCKENFQSFRDFLLHIPIHGVFRYGCGLCDFKSAINIQCITHLRYKHSVFNTKRVYSETEDLQIIIPSTSVSEKRVKRIKSTNNESPQQKTTKKTRDQTNEIANNQTKKKRDQTNEIANNQIKKTRDQTNEITNNQMKKANEIANNKQTKSDFKQTRFGPKDVNNLPHIPILADNIYCTECSFNTKVTSNMSRHLQLHISDTIVPAAAPINPVPHLQSNEMHFDKMTNLAMSSNIDKQSKISMSKPVDDETLISLFVPAKERFVCGSQNCTYTSVNELMLKQHWETLHREENTFLCVHCNKTIELQTGNSNITKPIILHFEIHEDDFYQCKHCPFVGSIDVVRHHIHENHNTKKDSEGSSSTEFYWQCSLCPKNTLKKEEMSSHCLEKHHVSDPYKCSKCNFTSKFLMSIDEHYDKKHKGVSSKNKIVIFFKKRYAVSSKPILNTSSDVTKRKRVSTDEESNVVRSEDKFKKIKIANYDESIGSNNNEILSNIKTNQDVSSKIVHKHNMESENNQSQKYVCPFCKKFSSHLLHLMKVHLFEELNYRKWSCTICGYKSFDSEKINTHSLMEHHISCQVKELTSDVKIESWVEDFLNNKISFESPLILSKLLLSGSQPAVERKKSFMESDKDVDSENSLDENRLVICDNTKSKMTHLKAQSEMRTLACKLCSFFGLHDKSLKLHYAKQHKHPCICRYCGFTSENELDLLNHHDRDHIDLVFEIVPITSNLKSRMARQDYTMCFECRKLIKASEIESHKSNCYSAKPINESNAFNNEPSTSVRGIKTKRNSGEAEQIYCDESISNKDVSVNKEAIEAKTVVCKLCNFVGKPGVSISLHNAKRHYRPCECKYCDYETNSELQLLHHHNTDHSNQPFEIIHTDKNPNANKTYVKKSHVCLQCKTPLEVSEIQYHELKCHPGTKDKLILHREAIVFQCSLCLNLFHDKTSLTVHFKNNHPSFEINYIIQRLGKTLKKSGPPRTEFDNNVNSDNKYKQSRSILKESSDDVSFNCAYCYKQFKSFYSLGNHHKKLHKNRLLIVDPVLCAQIQDTGEIKKDFNLKDGAYECILQTCKETFNSFLIFQEHVKEHYGAFKCMQCLKRFHCDVLFIDHCKFEHSESEFLKSSLDRRKVKTDRINQVEKLLRIIYEKHLDVSAQNENETNEEINCDEFLKKPRLESKQVARKSTTQIGYGFYKQK